MGGATVVEEFRRQRREGNLRRTDMLLSFGHPMTCNGGNPDVRDHRHDHEVIMEWTDDDDLRCPECGRLQPMSAYDDAVR